MMEKSASQEKENISGFNSFQNSFGNHSAIAPQFITTNVPKKTKAKVKPIKGLPANVRIGDWVCLICNNLNFSFRNECNRCQLQTKDQNQLQSLQISDNQLTQNNTQNRLPFQDLTNQNSVSNKFPPNGTHIKSKSTPLEREVNLKLGLSLDVNKQSNDSNYYEGHFNKGFENKLLVTPPKHGQTKSFTIFKEYSDSGQKELPPYRSPKNLPSVSPMLKRVFGDVFDERSDKIHQSFTFFKEEVEEVDSDYLLQEKSKRKVINNHFGVQLKDLEQRFGHNIPDLKTKENYEDNKNI